MVELTPGLLLRAYAAGVFPMAEDRHDERLFWVDPPERGVLPLDAFHVPRRLRRIVRADRFAVAINRDFAGTMRDCAESRDATWINDTILSLYQALHRIGHAHSIESWREGRRVGGLYGVSIGAAFFGESMFSFESEASKVALVHLVARLRRQGFRLLDIQFITDHLRQFGAVELARDSYRQHLEAAIAVDADLYGLGDSLSGAEALQSITQTS